MGATKVQTLKNFWAGTPLRKIVGGHGDKSLFRKLRPMVFLAGMDQYFVSLKG